MNIIRGVLKNIIDLSAAVRVDIKPNFLTSLPSRVLLSYAGLNKLFLSHCKISKKKKLSTTLQFYEPVKVKAMHIKFFMHRELWRYATIGYIINFCRKAWAIYFNIFFPLCLKGDAATDGGYCKTGRITVVVMYRGSKFSFADSYAENYHRKRQTNRYKMNKFMIKYLKTLWKTNGAKVFISFHINSLFSPWEIFNAFINIKLHSPSLQMCTCTHYLYSVVNRTTTWWIHLSRCRRWLLALSACHFVVVRLY